jgi:hypothetical protein
MRPDELDIQLAPAKKLAACFRYFSQLLDFICRALQQSRSVAPSGEASVRDDFFSQRSQFLDSVSHRASPFWLRHSDSPLSDLQQAFSFFIDQLAICPSIVTSVRQFGA